MLFPVARSDPYHPPPEYLAGTAPRRIQLSYGGEAWLITDFGAARQILGDTNFSSDSTLPEYPAFPLASKRPVPGHFLSMDPPGHTRLRRMVAADFSAQRVKAHRPRIRAAVHRLVAEMTVRGMPGDLVSDVAVPLPALSAADMLGVPSTDRDFFLACTRRLQTHSATPAQRAAAGGRVHRYLRELVSEKARGDGQDLLSRLARESAANRVSTEEVVGVANLILVAGLETTAGLVALTVLSLLHDPRQAALVRAESARWARPAVQESLRYWTLVQHGVARVATRDVVIAGQLIRSGDAVVVHLPSANRDHAVYADPDRFDITRDARGHLAFGYGVHRCLGSSIAQLQSEIAVAGILEHLPGLRLARPRSAPSFLAEMLVYGLRSLPVSW